MLVERAFVLGAALTLAAGLPLSLVAARGFREAPFGAVLRPVPVAFAGSLAFALPSVLGVGPPTAYATATATIAVLAAFLAAVHAVVLTTGLRQL